MICATTAWSPRIATPTTRTYSSRRFPRAASSGVEKLVTFQGWCTTARWPSRAWSSVRSSCGYSIPGGRIDDYVAVNEAPFVPSSFVVPLALAAEQFMLEPLGAQHNDSDFEAWSSSVEHIHTT